MPLNNPTINSKYIKIVAWGDSLTEGFGLDSASNPNDHPYPYPIQLSALTGNDIYNRGVSGDTSTQIKTRFLAEPSILGYSQIIWAGRNNYTSPTTVKADIAAMIAALNHTNYIIVGITSNNVSTEWTGQTARNTLNQLNTDLAALYGAKFFDMQAYLLGLYNAGTASAQDITDHNNGAIATSLTEYGGTLHRNVAGYAAVVNGLLPYIAQLQTSPSAVVKSNPYGAKQLDLDIGGVLRIGGRQALRKPDQSSLLGTIIVGDGGRYLTNATADNGQNNTLFGIASGLNLRYAKNCVAIGNTALGSNQDAPDHIAIGTFAFSAMTGGDGNIGIGPSVGNTMTGGFNNFLVGVQVNASSPTASNEINICNIFRASGAFGSTPKFGLGVSIANSLANLNLLASVAGMASLNMPHGVAPTTPNNGDMWTTTAGLFVRINGVTKTVTLT